jgi:hypothetical protein
MSDIGYGPWFVALLFNLNPSGSNKKQTELRIHSMAYVFATIRNMYSETDIWVTMMVIGPFYKYTNALTFFRLWSRQTRGKSRRLKRAITLLKKFHKQYELHLWVQRKTYEQAKIKVLKEREEHKQREIQRIKDAKDEELKKEDEMIARNQLTLKKLKTMVKF